MRPDEIKKAQESILNDSILCGLNKILFDYHMTQPMSYIVESNQLQRVISDKENYITQCIENRISFLKSCF